jgi:hypothetical protein
MVEGSPEIVNEIKNASVEFTPDIAEVSLSDTMGTSPNKQKFPSNSFKGLMAKYQIGKDALYNRMKYLYIKSWKDGKKAYYDEQQIAELDRLEEYIKIHGVMKGYPQPEPSGLWDEPRLLSPESKPKQKTESQQPVEVTQETTAITVFEQAFNTSLDEQQELIDVNNTRQYNVEEIDQVTAVLRNAQNKATAVLIAENELANQFINNPNLLSDELRAKIKESANIPQIDPFAYANALVKTATKAGKQNPA